MFSPLIRLLLKEPALLVAHLEAYADLAERDWTLWRNHFRRRLVMMIVSLVMLIVALGFGGMALLLWGATGSDHWVLWVVPGVPALISLVCGLIALMQKDVKQSFSNLPQQLHTDLKLLKEVL